MSQKAFLGGAIGARDMMLRKPQSAQKGGGGKPPEKPDDKEDKKPSAAVDAIKGATK